MAKAYKLFRLIILLVSSVALAQQNEHASSYFEFSINLVEISGKDFTPQKKYTADYQNNTIAVHFSKKNENRKIYYRIGSEHFGKIKYEQWKESTKNSVKYEDLIAGSYHLEFSNYPNNKQVISISFKINRPWWRTWWFWGACFFTLFGMFYGRERFLKFWADEEQKHHKQIVELELRTLQLQMNPHFIFNALNSIQSYMLTHDIETANNYLSKFAHLIRLFLDSSRSRYLSLSEEVRMLNLYCDIEKLRFENKFDFEIIVAPDINKFIELPTMILQPFVENAINHGLRYKSKKGFLSIEFYIEYKYLICKICDNGVGRERAIEMQEKSRKGYKSQGLKITAERLTTYNKINETDIQFYIRDKFLLSETSDGDVGTIVQVKFPLN